MTMRPITLFILTLVIALFAVTAAQAENCETIQFPRGHSSTTIKGVASPDSMKCYQITAAAGQTAAITISGVSMMFSVEGVTDVQDKYRFTTEKKLTGATLAS